MPKTISHTFKKLFITESGSNIPKPTIAYQTWGRLNDERNNAVVVYHALTGDASADEWFSGLFGPGKPLDPEQYFIICANVLGSCYGTSGPKSINPKNGKAYRADFPIITIRDMVRLQQQLLDEFQVTGIEMVIGGSMGGMQALEFCIMDDRPHSAVLIGMGKSHSPWAIGISHTQRQAIYNDPNWNGGYYSKEHQPEKGLALARMIAMNSYRHPKDFDQKFGRGLQDENGQFKVESYLNYQGQKLSHRFDAVSYVRLTQAMDSHDIERARPAPGAVLSNLRIPILTIGINSDLLYPPEECRKLADLLPNGMYEEIHSPYGHDAFLIEFDQINTIIGSFIKDSTEISRNSSCISP